MPIIITPEEIELLTDALAGTYRQIETDLLRNVSRYVAAGASVASNEEYEWMIGKLSQIGALRSENIAVIAQYSGKAKAQIAEIINAAGYSIAEVSAEILAKAAQAGVTISEALPLTADESLRQVLNSTIQNARSSANLVNTTMLQSADEAAMRIINQVYIETSTGISSYSDSMWKAVRQLADMEITGATYISASGRVSHASADVAVRRDILTSRATVAAKMQVDRARMWGTNLVEVSSHMGARPTHAEWQGRIYMIEGSAPGYPNLAEATGYGTGAGLGGYNCNHVMYPFFEGISEQRYKPYDLKENARAYEQSQEQRQIERDIRKYKRREAMAAAAGDEAGVSKARAKVREKQADMREFISETGRTRRREREQI